MNMKQTFIVLIIMLIQLNNFAQNFEVPKQIKLDTKDDYINLEQDVVKAVDWLIENPADKQFKKRIQMHFFIFKWVRKNPYFTFDTSNEIATFLDSTDCIAIFMGGMAKYSIESKDYSNKCNKNYEGIKAVIEFYKRNIKFFKKNRYLRNTKKSIEEYIKLDDSNDLAEFIKNNI